MSIITVDVSAQVAEFRKQLERAARAIINADDGERLDLCVEADSTAGWAVVHVGDRQPGGNVRLQRDEHGEPITRMLLGNVEIRMNVDAQPSA